MTATWRIKFKGDPEVVTVTGDLRDLEPAGAFTRIVRDDRLVLLFDPREVAYIEPVEES